MKKDLHPEMKLITVKCACGAEHKVWSTVSTFRLDVCSQCHPFYRGEGSAFLDTEGRIQKFKNKYGNYTAKK